MKSNVIDMHCDTLMHAFLNCGPQTDIYEMPSAMIDLKRLKNGGALAQFFAIFMVPQQFYTDYLKRPPISDEEYIAGCSSIFESSVALHSEIVAKALNSEMTEKNAADGKMSAILTMEDGRAVQGKLENLDRFYAMGIRALSLTWNFENCFGAPNSRDSAVMNRGLTGFGKDAVRHMQEIGMLVDVSHLSDGGFRDVAELSVKPFAATHSNCRALCPHPRNMTDEMIRMLADKGGIMGINFGPEFLSAEEKDTRSTVERMVAMAQHEKRVGGIDVIGIGTDFDGIEGDLEISGPDKMSLLTDGLSTGGFTDDEIDKITHGNALRVLREAVH